jgi:hypothetical protein
MQPLHQAYHEATADNSQLQQQILADEPELIQLAMGIKDWWGAALGSFKCEFPHIPPRSATLRSVSLLTIFLSTFFLGGSCSLLLSSRKLKAPTMTTAGLSHHPIEAAP